MCSIFAEQKLQKMKEKKQINEGNRLKAILAEKGITCRTFAQKIGMSENTVSRWCTNKSQPSLTCLYNIASILDVDVRTLLKTNKTSNE